MRSSLFFGSGRFLLLIVSLPLQQGSLIDRKSQRIAFRRARIVEDKLIDQEGLTWLFEINGVRIFCGGMSSDIL